MRFMFWLGDMMLSSRVFYIIVVCIICFCLIAIGGFVFWTIIKWIEGKW